MRREPKPLPPDWYFWQIDGWNGRYSACHWFPEGIVDARGTGTTACGRYVSPECGSGYTASEHRKCPECVGKGCCGKVPADSGMQADHGDDTDD
jgi:hypothetical protein